VSVPESGKSPFSAKAAEVCCSCHQDPGRKKENQNRCFVQQLEQEQ
jgi:hypothetical protein